MKKPVKVAKSPKPAKVAKPKKPLLRDSFRNASPSIIIRPSVLEVLEVAASRTTEASSLFAERLLALQDRSVDVAQDDLAASARFAFIGKSADAPVKSLNALLNARFQDAEREQQATDIKSRLADMPAVPPRVGVEPGSRVVTFVDNRKRSPSWKEVAATHAQILHAVADALAKGDEAAMATLLAPFRGVFDRKRWEEAVLNATPKTGDLSPKIVEGV